jgi:hypothetical protein
MPDKFQSVADQLRTALLLILDNVDYVAGNCGVAEPIGGILPKEIIAKAHEALDAYKAAQTN